MGNSVQTFGQWIASHHVGFITRQKAGVFPSSLDNGENASSSTIE